MESPQNIEEIEVKKRYDYVVGIDLGTYSTSVTFSYSDDDEWKTIDVWPNTNRGTYGGRVASSLLYRKEDETPLWGGDGEKKFHNAAIDFFFVPHVKLYLTDPEHQPRSPGDKLSSVKIISDYLQGLHKYCISMMKEYYDSKNREIETESLEFGSTDGTEALKYEFTEGKVRYVFSCPDNQENNGSRYKEQITEALIDAGIINAGDLSENAHESRVSFITDSGATAYHCSTLTSDLKPSLRPYLVCDIGGKVFGLSTIVAKELPETGAISSFIDQSGLGCGNLELDRNMRRFLEKRITSDLDDDQEAVKKIIEVVFEFYNDNIKLSFNGIHDEYYFPMDSFIVNMAPTIKSDCFKDGHFVFEPEELKKEVFDPVTDKILSHIDYAISKHDTGVSGIFLSGTIGQDQYLKTLVDDKFGNNLRKVMSVKNNEFAVSKGLVQYGIRQRGLMVPYFLKTEARTIGKVMSMGNENLDNSIAKVFSGVKTINHKGLEYFIGLDFGTTYSGFAFAEVPKAGETEAPKQHTSLIDEVSIWTKASSYPKAPSVLFYDNNMNYLKKFGYQAKEIANRNKGGVLLTNFKLLLARDFNREIDDGLLKKLDDYTTVDAIANYIRDFTADGIKKMGEKLGKTIDKKKLGYVVTVPAMWSDEAKNTMAVAVRKAGLVTEKMDERVVFITEAEAAALYCQVYFKDQFQMTKDQKFMICDCGGGTVDLVTFQVNQEEDDGKQLAITELTSGDGDNCGSAYLDEHFRVYLIDRLVECGINYDEEGIRAIVDLFVKEIKPNFVHSVDSNLEDDFKIPVPLTLNIPWDFDDPTGFIVDDDFVIPYAVMEKEVFMPVIQKVINLVDTQLRKLPDGERQLDAILIVGGFGQSSYLLNKLVSTFEGRQVGATFVGVPPNGDLAICRGAVSFGLKPRLVSEGITRYSYGIQVKDRARPGDDTSQKFIGDDDEEYCHNVFAEIVEKGTRAGSGRIYSMKTCVTYPHDPVFAIYSSDEKDTNLEKRKLIIYGLEPIYKITANIGKIPGLEHAEVGDKVNLEAMVAVTGTSLEVHIIHDGKVLSTGVTKVPAIVKTKYVKGTSGEKEKRKWTVPIFSLIKKY